MIGMTNDVPSGKLTFCDNSNRLSSGFNSGTNFLEAARLWFDGFSLMETLRNGKD